MINVVLVLFITILLCFIMNIVFPVGILRYLNDLIYLENIFFHLVMCWWSDYERKRLAHDLVLVIG